MAKLLRVPALMLFAALLAGVYGALHDQVSFTISPEYFFAFKFHQFQIAPEWQNRWGAALVGWLATWWMGALISVPLITGGLLFRNANEGAKQCLIAFAVAGSTAIAFGLGALTISYFTFSEINLPPYRIPEEVVDRVSFARVGMMHNASYLGGFVGIIAGLAFLAISHWRLLSRRPMPSGENWTGPPY